MMELNGKYHSITNAAGEQVSIYIKPVATPDHNGVTERGRFWELYDGDSLLGILEIKQSFDDWEYHEKAIALPQKDLTGIVGTIKDAVTGADDPGGWDTMAAATLEGPEPLVIEINGVNLTVYPRENYFTVISETRQADIQLGQDGYTWEIINGDIEAVLVEIIGEKIESHYL